MPKRTKINCLLLLLCGIFSSAVHSQQDVSLDLYPHETRAIAGHSDLDRTKYFSLAHHGAYFENKTSTMPGGTSNLLDSMGVSFGRALGLVYGEVRWGNTIREDPNRPGFVDLAYLRDQVNPDNQGSSEAFRARFGSNLGVAFHDRHNAYPDFFAQKVTPQSGGQWIPLNLGAAAEVSVNLLQYKWNDYFRPAFFELVNEPHWSFIGDQHFADWHVDIAAKVREADLSTKVGGPCSAVAYYYRNNYQDLDHFTGFIDRTEGDLDFYSFHVYDFMHWDATRNDFLGRVTSGLPLAGVIDALGGYMRNNYDKDLKMVISEHAGYIFGGGTTEDDVTGDLANLYFPGSGFDWEMERRSIANYISVSSAIANTMTFLDNPHIIEKAVPFILLESADWDPRYYSSLMVPYNFTQGNNYVQSDLAHFYQFFADVSGRRIRAKCEDPDLQHHAFVEGNVVTVLLNNLSNEPHTVNLNSVTDQVLTDVKIKRLARGTDFRPEFSIENQGDLTALEVAGREAIALELTYADELESTLHIDELPFYSEEVAQNITGQKVFEIEIDHIDALNYAYLRVGLDRPVNTDRDIVVKLNGTELTVPMEDAADRFEDDRSYASIKKIHFDVNLLQPVNEVEISFPDNRGGGVGAVVIRAGLEGFFSSLADRRPNLNFKMFPNPTVGTFTLELPTDTDVAVDEVTLHNIYGNLVKRVSFATASLRQSFEINQVPAGTYFVTLRSSGRVVGVRRLVKQ